MKISKVTHDPYKRRTVKRMPKDIRYVQQSVNDERIFYSESEKAYYVTDIKEYHDAKYIAELAGLTLAEYGDGSDYSTAESYCYWNKTGNRQDEPEVYIEYDFDLPDDFGRKTRAGTVHFACGSFLAIV
jgi:hypothetical protein